MASYCIWTGLAGFPGSTFLVLGCFSMSQSGKVGFPTFIHGLPPLSLGKIVNLHFLVFTMGCNSP